MVESVRGFPVLIFLSGAFVPFCLDGLNFISWRTYGINSDLPTLVRLGLVVSLEQPQYPRNIQARIIKKYRGDKAFSEYEKYRPLETMKRKITLKQM